MVQYRGVMHHKMIPGSFQKELRSLEFVPADFGSRFKVVFTLTYSHHFIISGTEGTKRDTLVLPPQVL